METNVYQIYTKMCANYIVSSNISSAVMLLTAAKTQTYLLKIDLASSIQQEKSDCTESVLSC